MTERGNLGLNIFSTCPQSRDTDADHYKQQVVEAARWSESAGCEGMLVYADNGIVDPWLISQVLVQATSRLCPLIAVQPAYMHPYSVAKMVTSLAYLHGRRVYLNLLAGGFRNDLSAMGDETEHDERYTRTVEYARVVKALVDGRAPVTLSGRYYRVQNLSLAPPVPAELLPTLVISGSSDAGLAAARSLGAIAIKYPRPPGEEQPQPAGDVEAGMRIGIITRPDAEQAWRVANDRFPEDRAGQIAHALAMQVSDSEWHRQLSDLAREPASANHTYWLTPFTNYKTFCPYLVGDHKTVAAELRRYIELGFRTFVVDIAPSEEDLRQTAEVFRLAQAPAPR
jgi:alkanesulfonate monooxygenase